jgi:thiopeptide-type bacteriocin biosynthesis protein
MSTERLYLSLHAHVSGHENAFLRQVFSPALAALEPAPATCFFLRYWQGGPHLRLRVRATPTQQALLRERIEERFASWRPSVGKFTMPDAAEHAAVARRFAALEGVPQDDALVDSPTLLVADYQPELTKYGGAPGLDIAEQVWHASTTAVLAANGADLLQGGQRARVGLQMALQAARAFGLSLAQANRFFAGCAQVWQAYCPGPASPGLEQRLAAQAAALQPLAAAMWQAPIGQDVWSMALQVASRRIAEQAPAIAAAMAGSVQPPSAARTQLYLLSQYAHTNNNRLGINPAEEWLQARLAQATLALCQERTPEIAHA